MGRGPTVPGSLGPPASSGGWSPQPQPSPSQPVYVAALILPRARRTMVRHTRGERRKWAEWEQQQQEHNQRQPQPPQPQPPRGRRNRGWSRWQNRLNDGEQEVLPQEVIRLRKKFFRKLFRRWGAKARHAPQARLLDPAFRQWRVACWLWHSGSGMLASLCRVILVRWAAVAREAVRTRACKARRLEARTRIALPRRAFWAYFWAWFTAARAGTLFRRGTLFWERAEGTLFWGVVAAGGAGQTRPGA